MSHYLFIVMWIPVVRRHTVPAISTSGTQLLIDHMEDLCLLVPDAKDINLGFCLLHVLYCGLNDNCYISLIAYKRPVIIT